jgi:hypothetical protein
LSLLEDTVESQKVILPQPQDLDLLTLVWQVSSEGLLIGSIFMQSIRFGKIVNVNNFLLTGVRILKILLVLMISRFANLFCKGLCLVTTNKAPIK